ncbi:G0/G1 switch protein 2-like [Poeciliopsis prolifica]|uniref:G0/G1 switch protein 2-like n=1 Tax=Poeciliopsis prolifica TaxID=188132 RepID=UPI0024134203|nr:G0/G1 switch protein 2-like [Poeciliopsis prolifica]
METMQELIPFAKEMLRQRANRKLLKVYLLGSVLAVLGTAIGLVETLCQPFSSGEPLDAEMFLMLALEQREAEAVAQAQPTLKAGGQEEEEEEQEEELVLESQANTQNLTPAKSHRLSQRNLANRLHAS